MKQLASGPAQNVLVEMAGGGSVVGVETVLLDGVAGTVVTVINWGGVALDAMLKLSLTLPESMGASELGAVLDAWSGQTLSVTVSNGSRVATVQVQARFANFIVFPRKFTKRGK
eukprot:SAG31_NODE_6255_length_2101_cov_1.641359_1_plen_114_part_00